jgi:four helix bundle protein
MKDLSNLRIYRLAVDIGEAIWAAVQPWHAFERWTLGKQLVESADGISANMIEGYYRISPGDKRKFFRYALSSAKEAELWWWKARKRDIITEKKYREIKILIEEMLPHLVNFIKTIK